MTPAHSLRRFLCLTLFFSRLISSLCFSFSSSSSDPDSSSLGLVESMPTTLLSAAGEVEMELSRGSPDVYRYADGYGGGGAWAWA
jgi:hypothetical protein